MLPLPGTTRFPTRDQLGVARPTWPDPDDAKRVAEWLIKAENPLHLHRPSRAEDPRPSRRWCGWPSCWPIPVMERRRGLAPQLPAHAPPPRHGPRRSEADVLLIMESPMAYMPGVDSPSRDAKIVWVGIDPVHSRIQDDRIPRGPVAAGRCRRRRARDLRSGHGHARQERPEPHRRPSRTPGAAQARDAGRGRGATRSESTQGADAHRRWVAYQLGKLLEPDASSCNDGSPTAARARLRPPLASQAPTSAAAASSAAGAPARRSAPSWRRRTATSFSPSATATSCSARPEAALWAARSTRRRSSRWCSCNGPYWTGTSGLRQAYPEGYAVRSEQLRGRHLRPTAGLRQAGRGRRRLRRDVTETGGRPGPQARPRDGTQRLARPHRGARAGPVARRRWWRRGLATATARRCG